MCGYDKGRQHWFSWGSHCHPACVGLHPSAPGTQSTGPLSWGGTQTPLHSHPLRLTHTAASAHPLAPFPPLTPHKEPKSISGSLGSSVKHWVPQKGCIIHKGLQRGVWTKLGIDSQGETSRVNSDSAHSPQGLNLCPLQDHTASPALHTNIFIDPIDYVLGSKIILHCIKGESKVLIC